MEHNRNLM